MPFKSAMGKTIGVCVCRQFSVSSSFSKSYYETLGIKPTATLTEIKNAYYKLSMIYHPDKNDGDEVAINKFRELTTAYEILSNSKKKKMYDKGMLHEPATTVRTPTKDVKKSKYVPQTAGRTAVYNFDEWTRAHYGNTFNKRAREKKYYMDYIQGRGDEEKYKPLMLLACIMTLFVCYALFEQVKPNRDRPYKPPST